MTSSKNLVNSLDNAVLESLSGHVLSYPNLKLHPNKKVVLAPYWNQNRNKIAVICGGGSGHEPFASGFVGSGMLTAAVAGSIYASPPASSIFHAIQCVTKNNRRGCFVIIPNYTGDCLNFGLAIEKTKRLNIQVGQIIVGEDCSIPKSEEGRAGKRGLCGIVFVIKIVGALAEKGNSMDELNKYAQLVNSNMATCGIGLHACSIPGKGLMFELPVNEVEFGLGIHGEAGYKRIKFQSARDLINIMLNKIIMNLNPPPGSSVALLVNNFGALSQLEQGIVTREAIVQLENRNLKVERAYSGLLMTSLNGSGVHITVLKLPQAEKEILLACLDEKTDASHWPGCAYSRHVHNSESPIDLDEEKSIKPDDSIPANVQNTYHLKQEEAQLLKDCLENACKALIANEEMINELDRGCGDGDCGSTLRRLAEGVLSLINNLNLNNLYELLTELSKIAEEEMGGTSGAIYSLMFTTAGTVFITKSETENLSQLWARSLRASINSIMKYAKAQLGDKTMLDVLEPICKVLETNPVESSYQDIAPKILTAAVQGCEATKNMFPKAGRASYVKQEKYLKNIDAGAFGVMTWVEAIVRIIMKA